MTHQDTKPVVVHMDVRKLKRDPDTNPPSFSKAKLEKLIEQAVVDAGIPRRSRLSVSSR